METPTWSIVMVQMATFLIGAVLLWFVAYKPIRAILRERRERIDSEQRAAEDSRKKAEALEKELNRRINRLEDEAKKKSVESEKAAKKLKDALMAAARKQALAVVEQGRALRKREADEMRAAVRRDAIRLSVAMARKVAGMALKPADQRRLVRKVVDSLPARLRG